MAGEGCSRFGCSLHYMHCNFCRPHQTLTKKGRSADEPAIAAGITRHPWSIYELIALLK